MNIVMGIIVTMLSTATFTLFPNKKRPDLGLSEVTSVRRWTDGSEETLHQRTIDLQVKNKNMRRIWGGEREFNQKIQKPSEAQ